MPATLAEITRAAESLWSTLDSLAAGLSPGDWSRRHGKDWVMAGVPYHFAYVDRDMVALPIERGDAEWAPPLRTLGQPSIACSRSL